jgi:hypothetical protein
MRRSPKSGERGSAQGKLIVTLAVIAAMVLAAIRIVPVYFAEYQFQDALNTESRYALTGYPKRNEEDIRDDIMKKAQDLGIPAKRESIQVLLGPTRVDISLDYSVPIDLVVYQWTPDFHPHADNHSI